MADDHGPSTGDLTWLERLAERPGSFGFHVALRRFDASFPAAPRIGEARSTSGEVLRIGQTPSSAFAPNEIDGLSEEGSHRRLAIAFFGLWGPHGPLPSHITDHAADRLRHGDATLARFADVFHHRMLGFFHRAWAAAQPTAALDRRADDPFAKYLGSLIGLALESTRGRDAFPDFAKLHYAGRLGTACRNADGLRDIIGDFFGIPTAIEEFVGAWVDLPDDARWRLGPAFGTSVLGRSIVLGARAWSRTNKFRIVLGPMNELDFEEWLPHASNMASLSAAVRFYTNDEWDWDVRLVVVAAASTALRLGSGRGRLGWTTRVGGGPGVKFELIVDPVLRRTRRVDAGEATARVYRKDE
jgi:type VI secretion system protein ImpH